MTIKTINCADCGGSFNYEPNPNYADNRKYCDLCGAKRKASFNAPQIANPAVASAVAVAANRGPNANKNTTMYTSYVKDLIVSGMTVPEAIEVVKVIKKAFE